MRAPGVWYDWSAHATAPGRSKPGGGVIELVQAVHAARGRIMQLNEAAGWLVDQGYCRGALDAARADDVAPSDDDGKQNRPIAVDLVPRLTEQGSHPGFVARGISADTCHYLRSGFYPGARGPLAGRLVFQVGGIAVDGARRVILTHLGRAATPEQEADGKWRFYRGFNPSLELYNLDNLILDPVAAEQAAATGSVLLVEGAFDVAKCVEAGVLNVVASFGARLSARQGEILRDTLTWLDASRVVVFYDRDPAGEKAAVAAIARLRDLGVSAAPFDWAQRFEGGGRKGIGIPGSISDPCDFRVEQLRWLKGRGLI